MDEGIFLNQYQNSMLKTFLTLPRILALSLQDQFRFVLCPELNPFRHRDFTKNIFPVVLKFAIIKQSQNRTYSSNKLAKPFRLNNHRQC